MINAVSAAWPPCGRGVSLIPLVRCTACGRNRAANPASASPDGKEMTAPLDTFKVPVAGLNERGAGMIAGVFDCARAKSKGNGTTKDSTNMRKMDFPQITSFPLQTLSGDVRLNRTSVFSREYRMPRHCCASLYERIDRL